MAVGTSPVRRSRGRTGSRPSPASSAIDSSTDMMPPTFVVILAGGSGTRLWPLTNADNPKPFLPLIRGKSSFRLTYERGAPVSGPGRVLVVAGAAHRRWVRRQAPE